MRRWLGTTIRAIASRLVGAVAVSLAAMTAAGATEPVTHAASPWSVIPFVLLLGAIAIAPLLAAKWWHRWYPAVSICLGAIVAGYYLFALGNAGALIHIGFEYASFISLILALYLCSAGIVISPRRGGSPGANLVLLLGGAVLSNFIGTTGAAMVLVRPYLRMNRGRLRPYHVAFFIFIVANVGGALTPIGDPPLLLGYLRGIDFFRFFELNINEWLVALALLGAAFWWFDARNRAAADPPPAAAERPPWISGWFNVALLPLVVAVVFLDPARTGWVPSLTVDGHHFSFLREVLLVAIGIVAYRFTAPGRLAANGFSMEPIREVALLFIGIFLTMAPALELIHAQSAAGSLFGLPLTPTVFYFGTGVFSAALDNAPTFVAFLAGIEGHYGLYPEQIGHSTDQVIATSLAACSVASVFWGAMTYIGNGPNFLVKSIAEGTRDEDGKPWVEVPSFFGYIGRFSLPILLPVLIVVWTLFYR